MPMLFYPGRSASFVDVRDVTNSGAGVEMARHLNGSLSSFDQFVSLDEDGLWHRKTERLGSPHVDN
jgi:hypothetical protein